MKYKENDEVVFDYKNSRVIGTIIGVSSKKQEYVIHHYMYGFVIGVPESDIVRKADPSYPPALVNDDEFINEINKALNEFCFDHEWEQSAGWISGPVEYQCKKCGNKK